MDVAASGAGTARLVPNVEGDDGDLDTSGGLPVHICPLQPLDVLFLPGPERVPWSVGDLWGRGRVEEGGTILG